MWPDENALVAAARALAADALPAYFVALPLALLIVAAAWWLAQRYARSSWRANATPQRRIAIDVGLRLAPVIVGIAIFASIAGEIGPGEELVRLDQAFSEAVGRSISETTRVAFANVTHLGDPKTLVALAVVVAIALFARGERRLALIWTVALAGSGVLNPALKSVFERARPLHEHGPPLAQGWSFPSGHSSGSIVAYSMLAWLVIQRLPVRWHLPAVLAATAIVFSVGCSRVFIQAHFASDVVAGFASGGAWLALCLAGIAWLRERRATPD